MDKAKVILTKYWVGISCALVALICIIVSSVVLAGYHTELHQKLITSAESYATLDRLLRANRNQPLLPDQESPEPLGYFPSTAVINWGENLVQAVDKQSRDALATVIAKNHQAQLVQGVLPNSSGVAKLDYRNAYIARLDPASPQSLSQAVLRGTLPPRAEEVEREKTRIFDTQYKIQIRIDPLTNQPVNEAQVKQNFDTRVARLAEEMRDQRASQNLMYIEAEAIQMDKDVANRTGGTPTPDIIWWSQLGFWVQKNVADGLAEANRNAKAANVGQSAVKRLLRIEFPIGPAMLFMPPGRALGQNTAGGFTGGGAVAVPGAIAAPEDPARPVALDPRLSTSGRTSDDMYDVVQFRVEMVAAAKDLPMIIKTLSADRLLTVLNVENLAAEDAGAAEALGYMYGRDPVVRVSLKCEMLFLRDWTRALMPPTIRDLLRVAKDLPAGQR